MDGFLPVVTLGLEDVNTALPTPTNATGHVITYVAVDSSGNTARVSREVESPTADADCPPCPPPLRPSSQASKPFLSQVRVVGVCSPAEEFCVEQMSCSVASLCVPLYIASSFDSHLGATQPPPHAIGIRPLSDTEPPVLTLRGACDPPRCVATVNLEGEVVWVYRLQLGEPWEDQGASCNLQQANLQAILHFVVVG